MTMNYEEFMEKTVEEFGKYLPEELAKKELCHEKMAKTNKDMDALFLKHEMSGNAAAACAPILYVEAMYANYLRTGSFEATMAAAANGYAEAWQGRGKAVNMLDELKVENLILAVVNTRQNETMLKNIPHREYLDLSVIYKVVISEEAGAYATISNSIASAWNMTEEELFTTAKANTRALTEPYYKQLSEFLLEMLEENEGSEIPDFVLEGMKKELESSFEDGPKVFVLTNRLKTWGAAAFLYEDNLHELASKLGSDLLILPSSIHEVLITTADQEPSLLSEMVTEINGSQVSESERLSNQVYRYDKDLRKVYIASENVTPLVV